MAGERSPEAMPLGAASSIRQTSSRSGCWRSRSRHRPRATFRRRRTGCARIGDGYRAGHDQTKKRGTRPTASRRRALPDRPEGSIGGNLVDCGAKNAEEQRHPAAKTGRAPSTCGWPRKDPGVCRRPASDGNMRNPHSCTALSRRAWAVKTSAEHAGRHCDQRAGISGRHGKKGNRRKAVSSRHIFPPEGIAHTGARKTTLALEVRARAGALASVTARNARPGLRWAPPPIARSPTRGLLTESSIRNILSRIRLPACGRFSPCSLLGVPQRENLYEEGFDRGA
jgi:hypothetical protein